MVQLYIDQKLYEFKEGHNLLHVCLSLGFNLPFFCWHPAMGSVGACRQCAVKQFKDEKDERGKLIMACMVPAVQGSRISIEDPEAKAFRKSVIEWLMTRHPHDCPVCDEGGECHLQDMTVMTGHTYRKYRFKKPTYKNQDLGPFINHEMNRCIHCYRCVRFYQDYAGGRDLGAFASHSHVYFGRHEDGTLENEFSGNLVEVCPTGVFTDKTLERHYTRKWDLQTAPSICPHCSLGCNVIPGERYGLLRRIRNRYHSEINRYFLCDRGRFGYEFVNSEQRIRQPLLRRTPFKRAAILEYLHGVIPERLKHERVIGIGSPRASLEANFALRNWVGENNFYSGMSKREHALVATAVQILLKGPARSPSLKEVENADTVFVLGEDLPNVAARLALALRHSGSLWIASIDATRLDDRAKLIFRDAPDNLARLGFEVAHALDSNTPLVEGLSESARKVAREIAEALSRAERPLVISGTTSGSQALLQAAANISLALFKKKGSSQLCLTLSECNTLGVGLLGGGSVSDAFQRVFNRTADTVIVVENDLFRRAEAAEVEAFLKAAKHSVLIDYLDRETDSPFESVLPATPFAESEGSWINQEGRAQKFYKVFPSEGEVQESWSWIRDLAGISGIGDAKKEFTRDQLLEDLSQSSPVFRDILNEAPPPDFRIHGQKIPRQPRRYSGRTAMFASKTVHEPPPLPDDSPFSFSMEGHDGQPPAPLVPRFWAPGWNSPQALIKFQQEVNGELHGGPSGVRLIEPDEQASLNYFQEIPKGFEAREEEWLIVPFYHVFGSEELSTLSPGVAERAPGVYIALSSEDASRLQLSEGESVELTLNQNKYRLPVQIHSALVRGVAGLPVGLRGLNGIDLPQWGRILSRTWAKRLSA